MASCSEKKQSEPSESRPFCSVGHRRRFSWPCRRNGRGIALPPPVREAGRQAAGGGDVRRVFANPPLMFLLIVLVCPLGLMVWALVERFGSPGVVRTMHVVPRFGFHD